MTPTPTELIEFSLPCEECGASVTVRSDRPREYIDQWLDGEITVRCATHRARR